MPRVMWKGAISFGLVHAPVALYPAAKHNDIDFDWLQKKTLEPVGYKRIVKKTGKEIDKEDIVKGIQYEPGKYVLLSDDEIRSANVKSTHTIDILAFANASELSFLFFETPYYLAPTKGGEKVYALLREALLQTKKIGVANVVIQTKQHLAALIPTETMIVLNTLRWDSEVRPFDDLAIPEKGAKAAGIKEKELTLAAQLIESMSEKWDPSQYHDTFRDDIMALVKRKIDAGQAEIIADVAPDKPEEKSDNVIDLTEILRRSLRGPAKEKSATPASKTVKRKPAAASRARKAAG